MNKISPLLPVERFLHTLKIVAREGQHLSYSWHRLYADEIDQAWVGRLESEPELAERLEAFISRFGRMQDTIADKLLPRWLESMAEMPGSQIETLNRAVCRRRMDAQERPAKYRPSLDIWLPASCLLPNTVHPWTYSRRGRRSYDRQSRPWFCRSGASPRRAAV